MPSQFEMKSQWDELERFMFQFSFDLLIRCYLFYDV